MMIVLPRLERRQSQGGKPRRRLTVTGVVASFHKNRDGDVDGLQLDDGTEVRFPARRERKADRRCFSQGSGHDRRLGTSGGIRNPRRNDQE